MGYPTVKNFDISFIKRTLENLEKTNSEFEFTMLVNSLLGLLILPNEYNIKDKREYNFDFLNKEITYYSSLKDIFKIQEINLMDENNKECKQSKFYWLDNSGKKINPDNITLGNLIKRVRNGIAHFGIIPTKDKDQWEGIIIRNYPNRDDTFNMEIYLTKHELETFAKFIANKYLNTAKNV